MTQIIQYIPKINRNFICTKGQLHCQQSINIVCLDSLCRDDPLACSVCFSQIHKYHKVVSLEKFLSDYLRNVKQFSKPTLYKKITKQHSFLKDYIQQFRARVNQQLDRFQECIQYYGEYLCQHLGVRREVQDILKTKLQPQEIKNILNFYDLNKSIRFILNNSLFDSDGKNMINMSQLLKQDRDKIYSLLDKMINMTQFCQREIMQAMQNLKFAEDTIRNEKKKFNENVRDMFDSQQNPLDLDQFMRMKKELSKLDNNNKKINLKSNSLCKFRKRQEDQQLDNKFEVQTRYKTASKKKNERTFESTNNKINFSLIKGQNLVGFQSDKIQINSKIPLRKIMKNYNQKYVDRTQKNAGLGQTEFEYRFSKYRHEMLTAKNNAYNCVSNISALKPQFALISPHLNLQPQEVRQWSLKIVNCRNFASANTLGVGIGTLSTIKLSNYEKEPTNTLLVTSQGYTLLNGKSQKTDFIFGTGDVLHFKYDPFYKLLEIEKTNGRKLTLRALPSVNQPLYIVVRLTYASDQVQIV